MNLTQTWSTVTTTVGKAWHTTATRFAQTFTFMAPSIPDAGGRVIPSEIQPEKPWPRTGFGCLHKLAPGEPFFILRGQDATASNFVRRWADQAEKNRCRAAKVAEARAIAEAMEQWPNSKLPD